MSTIYCMNCGAELDGNARYCSECGSPTLLGAGLVEPGPEAVRRIACPNCGALNDPVEKFCTSCGGALTQAPAAMLDARHDSYSYREAAEPARAGIRSRTLLFGAAAAVGLVAVLLIGAMVSGLFGGGSDFGSITEVATTGVGAGKTGGTNEAASDALTGAGIDVKETLSDYSWQELSIIAREMSRRTNRNDALAIAREYHLVDEAGNMSEATKEVSLTGMGTISMRLVDVYHDDLANGEGKAGLTFLASNLLMTHSINTADDITGGWEASEMRSWLNVEVFTALSEDVRTSIVDVDKHTDNVGHSTDPACVTSTVDKVWLPSMVELIGPIDWTWPSDPDNSGGYNGITNAEGSQYALFAAQGVQALSGNPSLTLAGSEGNMAWWERTPSPSGTSKFRVVTAEGDPTEIASTSSENGVCIGFCL
ncbi:MAG: zinc ribbon domain-containing protein [Atopobiaceae bacterium]|nr:zinc ribbon domain-containing protein [Atopobiaceae bacterium]